MEEDFFTHINENNFGASLADWIKSSQDVRNDIQKKLSSTSISEQEKIKSCLSIMNEHLANDIFSYQDYSKIPECNVIVNTIESLKGIFQDIFTDPDSVQHVSQKIAEIVLPIYVSLLGSLQGIRVIDLDKRLEFLKKKSKFIGEYRKELKQNGIPKSLIEKIIIIEVEKMK